MLSHPVYKVIHLLGILLLIGGLGALWALAASVAEETRRGVRKLLLAVHGTSMFVILFAGFGMLARLGISGSWPLWVWIKILIWVLLGASPVLLRRAEKPISGLFFLLTALGVIAAWAAVFHIGQGP